MAAAESAFYRSRADGSALGRVPLMGRSPGSRGLLHAPMRVFGSYAAVFVYDGTGRYRDERGVRAAVGAGDLILVFPEIAHAYGPERGGTWSEIFVAFQGPVFDLWRRLGVLDPARPIHRVRGVASWRQRLEAAWGFAAEAEPMAAVCAVQSSLAELLGTRAARGRRPPDWLAEARAALDGVATIREPDWGELAARCHVSYETFRKRFAEWVGLSPARYRDRRVVERAARLLEASWSHEAIAEACGFADAFHFSRRFKAVMGIAPREWRARVGRG